MTDTALDIVLASYRDMFGVKTELANELHRDACIEVDRLRTVDIGADKLTKAFAAQTATIAALQEQVRELEARIARRNELVISLQEQVWQAREVLSGYMENSYYVPDREGGCFHCDSFSEKPEEHRDYCLFRVHGTRAARFLAETEPKP